MSGGKGEKEYPLDVLRKEFPELHPDVIQPILAKYDEDVEGNDPRRTREHLLRLQAEDTPDGSDEEMPFEDGGDRGVAQAHPTVDEEMPLAGSSEAAEQSDLASSEGARRSARLREPPRAVLRRSMRTSSGAAKAAESGPPENFLICSKCSQWRSRFILGQKRLVEDETTFECSLLPANLADLHGVESLMETSCTDPQVNWHLSEFRKNDLKLRNPMPEFEHGIPIDLSNLHFAVQCCQGVASWRNAEGSLAMARFYPDTKKPKSVVARSLEKGYPETFRRRSRPPASVTGEEYLDRNVVDGVDPFRSERFLDFFDLDRELLIVGSQLTMEAGLGALHGAGASSFQSIHDRGSALRSDNKLLVAPGGARESEIFVIGETGDGKTTFFNHLSTVSELPPDAYNGRGLPSAAPFVNDRRTLEEGQKVVKISPKKGSAEEMRRLVECQIRLAQERDESVHLFPQSQGKGSVTRIPTKLRQGQRYAVVITFVDLPKVHRRGEKALKNFRDALKKGKKKGRTARRKCSEILLELLSREGEANDENWIRELASSASPLSEVIEEHLRPEIKALAGCRVVVEGDGFDHLCDKSMVRLVCHRAQGVQDDLWDAKVEARDVSKLWKFYPADSEAEPGAAAAKCLKSLLRVDGHEFGKIIAPAIDVLDVWTRSSQPPPCTVLVDSCGCGDTDEAKVRQLQKTLKKADRLLILLGKMTPTPSVGESILEWRKAHPNSKPEDCIAVIYNFQKQFRELAAVQRYFDGFPNGKEGCIEDVREQMLKLLRKAAEGDDNSEDEDYSEDDDLDDQEFAWTKQLPVIMPAFKLLMDDLGLLLGNSGGATSAQIHYDLYDLDTLFELFATWGRDEMKGQLEQLKELANKLTRGNNETEPDDDSSSDSSQGQVASGDFSQDQEASGYVSQFPDEAEWMQGIEKDLAPVFSEIPADWEFVKGHTMEIARGQFQDFEKLLKDMHFPPKKSAEATRRTHRPRRCVLRPKARHIRELAKHNADIVHSILQHLKLNELALGAFRMMLVKAGIRERILAQLDANVTYEFEQSVINKLRKDLTRKLKGGDLFDTIGTVSESAEIPGLEQLSANFRELRDRQVQDLLRDAEEGFVSLKKGSIGRRGYLRNICRLCYTLEYDARRGRDSKMVASAKSFEKIVDSALRNLEGGESKFGMDAFRGIMRTRIRAAAFDLSLGDNFCKPCDFSTVHVEPDRVIRVDANSSQEVIDKVSAIFARQPADDAFTSNSMKMKRESLRENTGLEFRSRVALTGNKAPLDSLHIHRLIVKQCWDSPTPFNSFVMDKLWTIWPHAMRAMLESPKPSPVLEQLIGRGGGDQKELPECLKRILILVEFQRRPLNVYYFDGTAVGVIQLACVAGPSERCDAIVFLGKNLFYPCFPRELEFPVPQEARECCILDPAVYESEDASVSRELCSSYLTFGNINILMSNKTEAKGTQDDAEVFFNAGVAFVADGIGNSEDSGEIARVLTKAVGQVSQDAKHRRTQTFEPEIGGEGKTARGKNRAASILLDALSVDDCVNPPAGAKGATVGHAAALKSISRNNLRRHYVDWAGFGDSAVALFRQGRCIRISSQTTRGVRWVDRQKKWVWLEDAANLFEVWVRYNAVVGQGCVFEDVNCALDFAHYSLKIGRNDKYLHQTVESARSALEQAAETYAAIQLADGKDEMVACPEKDAMIACHRELATVLEQASEKMLRSCGSLFCQVAEINGIGRIPNFVRLQSLLADLKGEMACGSRGCVAPVKFSDVARKENSTMKRTLEFFRQSDLLVKQLIPVQYDWQQQFRSPALTQGMEWGTWGVREDDILVLMSDGVLDNLRAGYQDLPDADLMKALTDVVQGDVVQGRGNQNQSAARQAISIAETLEKQVYDVMTKPGGKPDDVSLVVITLECSEQPHAEKCQTVTEPLKLTLPGHPRPSVLEKITKQRGQRSGMDAGEGVSVEDFGTVVSDKIPWVKEIRNCKYVYTDGFRSSCFMKIPKIGNRLRKFISTIERGEDGGPRFVVTVDGFEGLEFVGDGPTNVWMNVLRWLHGGGQRTISGPSKYGIGDSGNRERRRVRQILQDKLEKFSASASEPMRQPLPPSLPPPHSPPQPSSESGWFPPGVSIFVAGDHDASSELSLVDERARMQGSLESLLLALRVQVSVVPPKPATSQFEAIRDFATQHTDPTDVLTHGKLQKKSREWLQAQHKAGTFVQGSKSLDGILGGRTMIEYCERLRDSKSVSGDDLTLAALVADLRLPPVLLLHLGSRADASDSAASAGAASDQILSVLRFTADDYNFGAGSRRSVRVEHVEEADHRERLSSALCPPEGSAAPGLVLARLGTEGCYVRVTLADEAEAGDGARDKAKVGAGAGGAPRSGRRRGAAVRSSRTQSTTAVASIASTRKRGRESTAAHARQKSQKSDAAVRGERGRSAASAAAAASAADAVSASAGAGAGAAVTDAASAPAATARVVRADRCGQALVGRRVRVTWDDGAYDGKVAKFNSQTERYWIEYDDGDTKWEPFDSLELLAAAGRPVEAATVSPSEKDALSYDDADEDDIEDDQPSQEFEETLLALNPNKNPGRRRRIVSEPGTPSGGRRGDMLSGISSATHKHAVIPATVPRSGQLAGGKRGAPDAVGVTTGGSGQGDDPLVEDSEAAQQEPARKKHRSSKKDSKRRRKKESKKAKKHRHKR